MNQEENEGQRTEEESSFRQCGQTDGRTDDVRQERDGGRENQKEGGLGWRGGSGEDREKERGRKGGRERVLPY